jgi:hypothetical protein
MLLQVQPRRRDRIKAQPHARTRPEIIGHVVIFLL